MDRVLRDVRPRSEASLKPSYRITLGLLHRSARTGRWRCWVALCAAVSLILPSVALLPAASAGFESEAAHVHHGSSADRDDAAGDSREGLSDIPGSPTHPVNHDCTPCQVIKYLATSFLPQADLVVLPRELNDAPPPDRWHQPQDIVCVAVSPPIRAPPHLPV
jgi:hypothetical protein